ncbi:uncharacterized protein B0T15DRAFT_221056 [Chaetomium strumarium]|uniref:Uncharacterized protein n=1 Tax=Chaetomium strumarium TaxID=1170767 RepID=A0AAJ0GU34_9PEZI|nr:hypothetical protein B0T15DRAFT_221056 [Chaetomium strumarium]
MCPAPSSPFFKRASLHCLDRHISTLRGIFFNETIPPLFTAIRPNSLFPLTATPRLPTNPSTTGLVLDRPPNTLIITALSLDTRRVQPPGHVLGLGPAAFLAEIRHLLGVLGLLFGLHLVLVLHVGRLRGGMSVARIPGGSCRGRGREEGKGPAEGALLTNGGLGHKGPPRDGLPGEQHGVLYLPG